MVIGLSHSANGNKRERETQNSAGLLRNDNRLKVWQPAWLMCALQEKKTLTIEQWLNMKRSIIVRLEYRWLINFSWHQMNINRWNENEILVARHNRIDVLVRILVHRCDGTRVAHPEVYGIGLFVERSLSKFQQFWVKVLHQLGKVVGEIRILSLDIADGSTTTRGKSHKSIKS